MSDRAAWAIGGEGPRRWALCDRLGVPAGHAVVLPHQRATLARTFRLNPAELSGSARRILAQLAADRADGRLAVGWIGYEVGAALEGVASRGPSTWPDAAWWLCDPTAVEFQPCRQHPPVGDPPAPRSLRRQAPRYRCQVGEIVERIAAGEFYQVNLTVAAAANRVAECGPVEALGALLSAQPVPLGWAMAVPGRSGRLAASGSMERFLRIDGDRIATRPIKGTAPRGRSARADAALAADLLARPKERAENTMIVDMARNDLQRVCAPHTVEVLSLLQTVAYETLWHLESEVAGQLRTRDLAAILAATLPPASVTGCPKVQAMKAIAELERRRRGLYCGATFCLDPAGAADFAVAIRTLRIDRHRARLDVGAGIVADSNPEAEWRETCRKAVGGLRAAAHLVAGDG
ncbi:MAG: anthranilate synthase component I family protein [Deltaproteobacteria bacterium]|nr:anthranilate synthase component I family protein [Deltaproteobacteria bacterium]